MTLLLKTGAISSNLNLPVFNPSALELAVAKISGLTAWLEGDEKYIQSSGGILSAWIDRLKMRAFVTSGSLNPNVVSPAGVGSHPSRRALRFGFGGSLTSSSNIALKAQDEASVDLLGPSYTICGVIRCPIWQVDGGTELPAGIGSGAIFGNGINTTYMSIGVSSGKSYRWANNTALGTMINASSPVISDGLWHYVVASYDTVSKLAVIRLDGVQVLTKTSVTEELVASSGGLKPRIGGSGLTGSQSRFFGDMGAAFTLTKPLAAAANANDLATLESYLALIKGEMAA